MALRICSVEGCGREHYAHGYCNGHWQRIKGGGELDPDRPLQARNEGPCNVEGCDRRQVVKHMCMRHYARLQRTGTTIERERVAREPRQPRIRNSGRRFPDREGYIRVLLPDHMCATASGYVLEHRMVMADHLGRPLRRDEDVHHRNGDRTDNRLDNLELWIKSHPPGQRVEDILPWAREIVARYDTR